MRPITDARGQRLDVADPAGAGTVAVDPDLIRHVFINLLSNASKYSPRRHGDHPVRRAGRRGLRSLRRARPGPGHPRGGRGADLREVLPGARGSAGKAPGSAWRSPGRSWWPTAAPSPARAGQEGGATSILSYRRGQVENVAAPARRRKVFNLTPSSRSLVAAVADDVPDDVESERRREQVAGDAQQGVAVDERREVGVDDEGGADDQRADDDAQGDAVGRRPQALVELVQAPVLEIDREVVVLQPADQPVQLVGQVLQGAEAGGEEALRVPEERPGAGALAVDFAQDRTRCACAGRTADRARGRSPRSRGRPWP